MIYILDTLYGDFPTKYETNLNEYIIPIFIGIGIAILLIILFFIGLSKLFKKADRSPIAAIIPIYNIIVLLEIVHKSKWYLLWLLIPGINIIISFHLMYKLAKLFRKSTLFSVFTMFFPFIALPIIGYSRSEYIGINEEAMSGLSIAKELPVVTSLPKEITKTTTPAKELETPKKNANGNIVKMNGKNEMKTPTLAGFRVESTQEMKPQKELYGVELFNNVSFIENQESPKEPEDKFIDNSPLVEKKDLNENQDPNQLSFVAPIPPSEVNKNIKIPTNLEETKETGEGIAPQAENNLSFQINPQIQSLTDQQLKQQAEYIACPKCGARIKNGSSKCFMCGKEL
ncbi:MAG: zinc ribbon domain-containing protein [Firmicutes bacterium]|nr:zinc ribbon domain-containing protein [Bacillota bacterium]